MYVYALIYKREIDRYTVIHIHGHAGYMYVCVLSVSAYIASYFLILIW